MITLTGLFLQSLKEVIASATASVWIHAAGKVRQKTLNILVSPLLQMFHGSLFVGIEEIITALLA